MTDFEIEKTMIIGMVKSTFKGVRVVSDPRLVDEGSFKIMIPKKAAEKMGPISQSALLLASFVNQGRRPQGRHFQGGGISMKYETVEKKMLAGYMPGGYAAVTRRQVAFFLMQLFGVDESSITRWRVQGNIPPKRSERLIKLFPEFGEDE